MLRGRMSISRMLMATMRAKRMCGKAAEVIYHFLPLVLGLRLCIRCSTISWHLSTSVEEAEQGRRVLHHLPAAGVRQGQAWQRVPWDPEAEVGWLLLSGRSP